MTDTHDTKVCSKCGQEKTFSDFWKNAGGKFGLRASCKKCSSKQTAKWEKENRKSRSEKSKEYQRKKRSTKEGREKLCKISCDYKKQNRNKINLYYKNKRINDNLFLLKSRYRNHITHCFRKLNIKKLKSSKYFIGCSWDDLLIHIEKQFLDGMCWENRSEWHIDHIIPLASAKTEEDVIRLNHFTNLRPLWAKDNLSKGAKMDF